MEYEIRPLRRFSLGLSELWEYRELFYFFTLRDIKVKYKQTVLGFLWAVLQPLVLAFLFTHFLGRAISSYSNMAMPYDLFALSGLVLWGIFAGGLNNAGNSMVTNANIIKKIYFPRLIIPLSAVLVSLFDFVMAFIVFLIYCIAKEHTISAEAWYCFPLAVFFATIATFGTGCLLASLNVKYRDFRYVIPFMIQFLLFLSPVIYPAAITGNSVLSWLMALNPMSAPLSFFRWGLSGVTPDTAMLALSVCSGILLFLLGIVYFRKTEAYFADLA